MEPNRVEFQKQCIFQSFCKRVLHNEACNAHEEIRRRRAKEVSFPTLPCMRNGSFIRLISIFKPKKPSRAISRRERKSRRSYCLKQSALCREKKGKLSCCTISRA